MNAYPLIGLAIVFLTLLPYVD